MLVGCDDAYNSSKAEWKVNIC